MAEVIARTCRISRHAIPCSASLSVILMHRDCVSRDRGVAARKVEIELQRLQPPRYSQWEAKLISERDSCGSISAEGSVDPTPRFCLRMRISSALSIASLGHDSDDRKAVDSLTSRRLTACTRYLHSGICLPIATSSNLMCLCVLLVCRLGILFPSRITIITAEHIRDEGEYMVSTSSICATYKPCFKVRLSFHSSSITSNCL
jgi:hypothetical protein